MMVRSYIHVRWLFSVKRRTVLTRATRNMAKYRAIIIGITFRQDGYSVGGSFDLVSGDSSGVSFALPDRESDVFSTPLDGESDIFSTPADEESETSPGFGSASGGTPAVFSTSVAMEAGRVSLPEAMLKGKGRAIKRRL